MATPRKKTGAANGGNNGNVSHRVNMTPESLRADFEHHLRYTLAKSHLSATKRDRYYALALAIRDRVIERWIVTQGTHKERKVKRVYYLSLEFLIGRLLGNNVINLRLEDDCREAMKDIGLDWNTLRDFETDAGLGNGGLGRLAACFLDSLSTLEYPGFGYGLRYDYGIFKQKIVNGYQVEEPDGWLKDGYPWEIARPEYSFEVHFGGKVEGRQTQNGMVYHWIDSKPVLGIPYDLPVVGYGGDTVNSLRLWSAKAAEEFDLDDFNRGSYVEAVQNRVQAENLTRVLYPNDNVQIGKELRFKQQYFFVCCTLQDIIRRFKIDKEPWSEFPNRAFIHMNDTHPALVIPELMRLLMDNEGLAWEQAWDITSRCTGYTNHTILPEALERWPVEMFEKILPRHLQIVYEINARFMRQVAVRFPMDTERLRRMSIIEGDGTKAVRMANLAIVGSCSVNGVAELHTKLLKEHVFRDFTELWPKKFNNKTNGITPRRWLLKANPPLASLITEAIGDKWIRNLEELRGLEKFAKDSSFREKFRKAKQQNKVGLAGYIQRHGGVIVDPDSIFDVQVKRIHEYKRQLLLALYTVILYRRIKNNPGIDVLPRTFIFSGKSAPGYAAAKRIIKLINQIGETINADPDVNDKIKVLFLPNYRVSLAERVIPAANVSEQISLAGTEASGTGNMKFQLNGALTVGTLDGANVEIREEVGKENIFIFGMTTDQVQAARAKYNPRDIYEANAEIRDALDMIEKDFFSMLEPGIFKPIIQALLEWGDYYMHLADLGSYIAVQARIDKEYRNHAKWDEKAIINVARSAKFSSDRTIRQYADEIWKIKPCDIDW